VTRPAAVAAWALAGIGISVAGTDPLAKAVVLGAAWLLVARCRETDRRLRPLALGLVLLGTGTVLTNGLLDHTGATALVTLPGWVPLLGGTITAEAFAAGGVIALGLLAAVSVAATLSFVLEPADLVDAMPRALHRTGAALGSALNLVPATAASFVAVRDAQRLRGWKVTGPSSLVDLAVPVLLGAIDRSVQLAESMEARAFGSGARTSAVGRHRDARGALVGIGALAALAAMIGIRLAGAAAPWYPYPTPSVPSVSLPALAPAVVLGALSFLVRPAPA
jgi:energy-coupling factor transport system permease protein